jgi:NTP pyrophosphatase (non-canonical NTP hydrolase)
MRDPEVVELKREIERWKEAMRAHDVLRDALRQELEAEKAAHGRTKELYASALDCLKKAKDYGEAQREHALFASPPASPDTLPLRPAVAWFAQAMERKLRENDHKGGWLDDKCDLAFLLGKLTEERSELTRAIRERGTPEQCLDEAADVANIAMMIADVCQPVVREDGWDQPVDAAHWRSQQNQDSGSPGEAARDAAIVASEGSSPKESARSGDASLPKKKCRCASAALGSTCCDICEHDLSCPIHGDGTDCYGVAPVPEVADASLSTDRARLEAEGWCFEAPPPGEIGNWHDVLFCGKVYQGTYARLNYEQWCSSSSLMNWHEATLCAPGDVTAWRRAKPIAPSPDAGIEAVKAEVARLDGRVHALEDSVDRLFAQGKRLAELELQGSVTRKLAVAALLAPGPVSEKDIPDALARIERLEHERAGKAP